MTDVANQYRAAFTAATQWHHFYTKYRNINTIVMKNTITGIASRFLLLFLSMISAVYAFAQYATNTSHTSTQTQTTSTTPADAAAWMNNPMVWVAGGVALLLIIVAIVASRSKTTSKTQVTRTTTTEVKAE